MTNRNDKNTRHSSISKRAKKTDKQAQRSTLELWQHQLRTIAKQKDTDTKSNMAIVEEKRALLHTVENEKSEYSEHSFSVSVMSHNSEADWATE